MSSRMEQIIEEIEDYINSCKYAALSSNKILVNKEELEELIQELRTKTPEEIKRYQKIISNKEAILADAQANEVVQIATKQAQEILDNATNEANSLRMGAMSYTDSQLKGIEDILANSIDTTKARSENLVNSLQEYLDVVSANRAQLFPQEPEPEQPASKAVETTDDSGLAKIDITNISVSSEEE